RAYSLGPAIESLVGIAALVELLVAVESHVDEVARDVFEVRPAPGRVRDDERDVVLAQQLDELAGREALVTDLERVPQLAIGMHANMSAILDALVVASSQLRSLFGRAR